VFIGVHPWLNWFSAFLFGFFGFPSAMKANRE
jgi:hypothetical protein